MARRDATLVKDVSQLVRRDADVQALVGGKAMNATARIVKLHRELQRRHERHQNLCAVSVTPVQVPEEHRRGPARTSVNPRGCPRQNTDGIHYVSGLIRFWFATDGNPGRHVHFRVEVARPITEVASFFFNYDGQSPG